MKRSVKIGALVLGLIMAACLLVACKQQENKSRSIVGTWTLGNGMDTVIFRDDGSCNIGAGYVGMCCLGYTYNDKQIIVSWSGDPDSWACRKDFYNYSLSSDGKKLTLIDSQTKDYVSEGVEAQSYTDYWGYHEVNKTVYSLGYTYNRVD